MTTAPETARPASRADEPNMVVVACTLPIDVTWPVDTDADVFEVDPRGARDGGPWVLSWMSPFSTHHQGIIRSWLRDNARGRARPRLEIRHEEGVDVWLRVR